MHTILIFQNERSDSLIKPIVAWILSYAELTVQ